MATHRKPINSNAKSRRDKENREFSALADLLPLPCAITSQLDKASVIRLTRTYLYLRTNFPTGFHNQTCCWRESGRLVREPPFSELSELASHILQTLDGFVFVLDADGNIVYISETASVHLGLSQVELIGNSLYNYVHPDDVKELNALLRADDSTLFSSTFETRFPLLNSFQEVEVERTFFLRVKCVLAKRNAGLTMQGYKVIHCSGYLKLRRQSTLEMSVGAEAGDCIERVSLMAIGSTLPSTAATEIRLSPFMFMLRTSQDFKVVFLDARSFEVIGYDPRDLLDRSLYELVHIDDIHILKSAHRQLLKKNQVTTDYFRLMVKHGGWIWLQDKFTLRFEAELSALTFKNNFDSIRLTG